MAVTNTRATDIKAGVPAMCKTSLLEMMVLQYMAEGKYKDGAHWGFKKYRV